MKKKIKDILKKHGFGCSSQAVDEILALFSQERSEELKLLKYDFLVLAGDYKELLEENEDLKMRLEDYRLDMEEVNDYDYWEGDIGQ